MKRLTIVVALFAFAVPLFAQSGRIPGMRGTTETSLLGTLKVTPNGTVYAVRANTFTGTDSRYELVAVAPSGATLWHTPLPNGTSSIVVSDAAVYVVFSSVSGANINSQIEMLYLASGGMQWGVTFTGLITDVQPWTQGVYVIVANGRSRKLVSISNSGNTNFEVLLD